ncbi:MAG: 4Fe-4S binding protein [Candidatus Hodarchaeota archaeon]
MANQETSGTAQDMYRELQLHLDTFPVGFPSTKSGVEIRLLKQLFTPEEAQIASKLKFYPLFGDGESLKSIFKRFKKSGLKYSKRELENHLDTMAEKGSIKLSKNGNQKAYSGALLLIGMFEFQVNKLTKKFTKDMKQYMREALIYEMAKNLPLQMRTIPVGVTIDHETEIAHFDDVKNLVENAEGPFSLANCVCRQSKNTLGKICKATSRLDVCIGFGALAQMYIDMGWAREISRKEAIETLKKNEEDGLVFQPGNSQKTDFICSCCGCCCEVILSIKIFPNPGDIISTNHYAKIDSDLCIACGTCIERCQMEAITLNDDVSSINKEYCIGCGNCVIVCPNEAIELLKKDKQFTPSPTMTEYYDQNLKARTQRKQRELRKLVRSKKL